VTSKVFESRYRGGFARDYDAGRVESPRWKAESEVFTQLLTIAAPRSVLDCPFGTGRWIDWYRGLEGPIIGLDKSEDMLAEAAQKVGQEHGARFKLASADIFEHDFSQYQGVDLVVNTRFLNWIPRARARRAVAQLANVRSPRAIIGCSVIPRDAGLQGRLRMRIALWLENAHAWLGRAPLQFVHDETELMRWFADAGWDVDERRFIFRSPSRENYFYMVTRRR
jgi:SAM-dependent methyltransferase